MFLIECADELQFFQPQTLVVLTKEHYQPVGTGSQVFPVKAAKARHIRLRITGAVTESGKPAAKADGVKFLRMKNHVVVYAAGSGAYHFQSTLMEAVK
ncbi:MAG: hypothetical protein WCS43_01285 [Verrucomicrobiota bacterium]